MSPPQVKIEVLTIERGDQLSGALHALDSVLEVRPGQWRNLISSISVKAMRLGVCDCLQVRGSTAHPTTASHTMLSRLVSLRYRARKKPGEA